MTGALLCRPFDSPTPPFPLAAVDTETVLFKEPVYDPRRKTRLAPPDIPEIVLGSIAVGGEVSVLRPDLLVDRVSDLLHNGHHCVFHNVAFDVAVLSKRSPGLRPLLLDAVEEGRIHDSAILECLIQIARGAGTVDEKVVKYVSLDELARRRCGMKLSKDPALRLGFGAFADPRIEIPLPFLEYASGDAEATFRVYCNQYREALLYADPPDCRYPAFPRARERWGLLTETIQVKGALALGWLEQFPLRIDLKKCNELRTKYRAEYDRLSECLLTFGFAKRTPKSKKFSVKNKHLREVLGTYARSRGIVPPYSASGLVSLDEKFWSDALPKLRAEDAENPEHATTEEGRLAIWLRFGHVRKLLTAFLDTYGSSEYHYPTYWNLGARTGRSSATRPSIQQVPKHRDSLRGMFIPSPGRVLLERDLVAAELVSLSQIYHSMFGGSLLGQAINAGEDPHIAVAKRILGTEKWNSFDASDRKRWRQLCKIVNYGLGGGMGYRKFAAAIRKGGVQISDEEAKSLRAAALDAEPSLKAYLSDSGAASRLSLAARNLNLSLPALVDHLRAWRDREAGEIHERLALARLMKWARNGDKRFQIPTPPGFQPAFDLFNETTRTLSGRVRGRVNYCAARNTPFQGLIADVLKTALWRTMCAHIHAPAHWSPVTQCHDSFLVNVDSEYVQEVDSLLDDCFSRALQEFCPNINGSTDSTGALQTWSH